MTPKYTVLPLSELIRELISSYVLIGVGTFLAMVVAAIIMILTENEFKSTANLMPAQDRTTGLDGLMSGRLGGLAGSLLGGGSKTTFDRYAVLLNSETVKERMIDQFNLMDVYETRGMKYPLMETKKELANRTNFTGAVEGNFLIEVWDTDPLRAQAMANHYVALLNEFNTEISVKESRMYREFIESRYNEVIQRADTLRTELADFQRSYGVYELPTQLETYFSLIGELISRKIQVEAQMNILESTVGKNSDRYKQANLEYRVIQKNIDDLYASEGQNPVELNLAQLPEIGTQYYRLLQEIEIHTEIMKYVTPIYEHAKLEEAKSLPMVTVVDAPRIAEKKDRPGRSKNVLIATFSAFLFLCFFVLVRRIYITNKVFFRSYFTTT